ncbi:MAG: TRAP transporter substrate-binding protein DctP [Alphaproteobacteria bacterium]
MRKFKTASAVVGVATAAMLAGVAAEAATLTVTTSLNRNHDQVVAYFDLMHNPMNAAKGAVTLKYKGGPEVIPNRKQGAALKRGVIDFMFGPSGYYAGLVPCARVVALSTQPQSVIRKNGGWDVLQNCWKEGLNGKILAHPFYNSGNFHVYLIDPPRKDKKTGLSLKGFKMRSTALYHPFMKAMGAMPINISPGDVYTSLERGLVKGLAWPEGGIFRYGWTKYIKYRIGPGFWRSSTMAVVNLDAYNKMTKKERDSLDAWGLKFEKASTPYMRALADKDNVKVFGAGVKAIDLPGEYGKAFTKTVMGSTWAAAEKKVPAKFFKPLKKLLLK